MKILPRLLLALAIAIGPIPSIAPLYAWTHGSASTVDTLLVPIIGDSNAASGECFNATNDTLSPSSIIQLKHNFTTATAQEPLDYTSMGTCEVGSSTKLVQLLVSNGKVPAGVVRIVIIPSAWAGTGLNNDVAGSNAAWVPAGSTGCAGLTGNNQCGCALDGGGTCSLAAGKGLYGMIAEARSLFPNSKIWFINAIEGGNDGSMHAGTWQAAVTLLINDIRSKEPDAASVPILWTGIPPDKYNTSLGDAVNFSNVIHDQQIIATYISNAFYVDPTVAPVLHSYFDNTWIHYNSASHRGGTPAFPPAKITGFIDNGAGYNAGNPGLSTQSGVAGTKLTVTAVSAGALITSTAYAVGGSGVTAGTTLTTAAQLGTPWNIGQYTVSASQLVNPGSAGEAMTIQRNNADGTPQIWSASANYAPAGSFTAQEVVLASDGFIYTCILATGPTGGNASDPTTDGGVHWSKQWDTTAAVAVSDSLAGRFYTALVTQFGF